MPAPETPTSGHFQGRVMVPPDDAAAMVIVLGNFDDDAITGNDANRILHEPTGEEGQQLVAVGVEQHPAVTATNVRACTHKIAKLINVRFGLLCGLRSENHALLFDHLVGKHE
jgi:hypothetical protein